MVSKKQPEPCLHGTIPLMGNVVGYEIIIQANVKTVTNTRTTVQRNMGCESPYWESDLVREVRKRC